MATTTIPSQDLPVWMRRAQRRTDWGVLLVLALGVLVASSFLFQPGLPRTNASERYVYMTSDMATALREGRFYPRWSPNTLGGYGAPIPHFYPPGASYSAALAQIFLTGNTETAVRLMYSLALCLAAAVTYTLVARRASPPAGLIAAALYLFSPYVGLVEPHILGDLPGVLGLALLPSVLWAVDRLLAGDQAHDLLLLSVAFAALLLTDPRLAPVAVIMVATQLALFAHRGVRGTKRVATGLLLGAILSSFFWLPALVEATSVHWYATSSPQQATMTLRDLFSPLLPTDPDALIPDVQLTLGLTGMIGAIVAAISLRRLRSAVLFEAAFLGIGLALAMFALLIAPTQGWLLGPITLCIAIAASAVWLLVERWTVRRRGLALSALLIAILTGALPVWTHADDTTVFENPTTLDQIDFEQNGYGIAVLPPGDPLPSNSGDSPLTNRALLSSYQSGIIDKIASDNAPSSIEIGVLEHDSHSDRFSVRVPAPTAVTLLTSYFDGWTASIGATTVPLQRSDDGLIRLALPAKTGELSVTLGPTPVRTAAWALSWAAIILLAVITWRRFRGGEALYDHAPLLTLPQVRLLTLVVIGFVFLLAGVRQTDIVAARPGYRLDGSTALHTRTNLGLEALAYRTDRPAFHRPGERVEMTLYWRALRPLPGNYRVRAELVNATPGIVYPATDLHIPGNYPTRRWLIGRYVDDRFSVPIPNDVMPGQYVVGIEVFDCENECDDADRLTFFDAGGADVGQVLLLPSLLTVTR